MKSSVLRIEQLEQRVLLAGDLRVDNITPLGGASTPFSSLEVEFSKPVDDTTIEITDLSILGPGTPSINNLTRLSETTYQVDLLGTSLDAYVLTVGPNISDTVDAIEMNQNGNATPGEADDAFVGDLLATDLTIANGDTTYDGDAVVAYGNTLTIEGDHTFTNVWATSSATILANGLTLGLANLTIDGASTVELAGGSTLNASGSVLVTGASNFLLKGKNNSAQVDGAWVGEGATINAANVTVDLGSSINADGQGYTHGQGPSSSFYATHGGLGTSSTASTYGDSFQPIDLGSGSNSSYTWAQGGGAIRLTVSDTLTLEGRISADGLRGGSSSAGHASGGSIWIDTNVLAGAGTLTARGSSVDGNNSSGGGGRIAAYYANASGFTGFSTATTAPDFGTGESGTIGFFDTTVTNHHLSVHERFELDEDSVTQFGALTLDDAALFELGGGATLTVDGSFVVTGNSTLEVQGKNVSGQVDGAWVGEGATINAANVTVDVGSSINADGQGYTDSQGPGTSHYATHGGLGTDSTASTYGDSFQPTDLGSGSNYSYTWTKGGGAIRLTVSDTLTLEGRISADGLRGGSVSAGHASGGSIWIDTYVLAGAGTLTARGSSVDGNNSSGGGGRIAAYYADASGFTGFSTATTAPSLGTGETGTVGFFDTTVANHHLSVYERFELDEDSVTQFGALTLDDAALFELGGGATLTVDGSLLVTGNSTLEVQGKNVSGQVDGAWVGEGATINAANVTVDLGSSIDADGQGYTHGQGPGTSWHATHGGLGTSSTASTYGDSYQPTDLGSGSDSSYTWAQGGGAIRLSVSDTLTLFGDISADGQRGGSVTAGHASGGSIWIDTYVLAGAGTLTARGSSVDGNNSSGGGGRIAAYYADASGFTGFSTATTAPSLGTGETGTVGFFDTTVANHHLSVYERFELDEDSVTQFGALTLDDAALFELGGGATLTVDGSLLVTGNSTLEVQGKNVSGQVDGAWVGEGATINAANVTVDLGSSINADGQGYTHGQGPGTANHAAHGGLGNSSGGSTYGDSFQPIDLGSGSDSYYGVSQGGGAIRLSISDTLTLEGRISADGQRGGSSSAGHASGGSIWIDTYVLAGAGTLKAQGSLLTNGGGGGRIAVYYDDGSGFAGFTTATAASLGTGEAGTVGFFDTTVTNHHLSVHERFELDEDSVTQFGALTLDDAALFELGGGSTFTVGGDILLAGSSMMRIKGKNVSSRVGGVWAGEGSTVFATNITVGAGSTISADGQGYSSSMGLGAGIGSYTNSGGGSHGGTGGGNTGSTYGDANLPIELGSAGGWANSGWSKGGGAAWLDVTDTLTVDGLITANGTSGYGDSAYLGIGGGAGGSILINTSTLAGSGSVTADGQYESNNTGGGGRVAVHYSLANTLPEANVTALRGDTEAEDGTVVFNSSPIYRWIKGDVKLFHGTEPIGWAALAVDRSQVTVDLKAFTPSMEIAIGTQLSPLDETAWDTTAVADGVYELRAIFRDNTGEIVDEISRTVVVNNSLGWHEGQIDVDETWAAGTVHVVDGNVIVPNGVTVTIEPGAIVKFAGRTGIKVESGGILDAQATPESPIVFTSIVDDSVGGDTNVDGADTLPRPGDWTGIGNQGGQVLVNDDTSLLYCSTTHGGNLASSEAWAGSLVHHVTSDLIVPNGFTLTINPGAVLKIDPAVSIRVDTGGVLVAEGTLPEPITFTSIRDDSVGGDSNIDGIETLAAPGDWKSLYINGGQATLNHCVLSYGAGSTTYDGTGTVRTGPGALVTISNSVIRNAFYEGVTAWTGGDVTITNTVIADTDRAVNSDGSATVRILNCTLDNNRIGIWGHRGSLDIDNTIISNSLESGIDNILNSSLTINNSNVWSTQGSNYVNMTDPTGTNGNISVDPKYRNASQENYRLDFGSPVIDAADGTVAPTTDMMGAPRFDDPRTTNTGVAMADGTTFPDMGAFEFVEGAESNLDLVVSSIVGPTEATAGDEVLFTWTVTNEGTDTAIGPWHDSIYLAYDFEPSTVGTFAKEVLGGLGVTLGPGESHTMTTTVRVPGGVLGSNYWQVKTNNRGEVFEGQNAFNNLGIAAAPVVLDLPELTIDGPSLTRTFSEVDESHWFKYTPTAGQDILVSLDLVGDDGTSELYVARGRVPTQFDFDARSTEWQAADTTVFSSNTTTQPYYITARADTLTSGTASFTISAESLTFSLNSASPGIIGNTGNATLKLEGGQLTDDLTYQIVGPSSLATTASSVYIVDTGTVFATFDTTGLEVGQYDVEVVKSGQTVTLADALTIETGVPASLEVHMSVPEATRPGWTSPVVVDYKNTGNTDMVAPLMLLDAPGANLSWPGESTTHSAKLLMGISPEGPAGILSPGQAGSITLEMTPGVELSAIDFTISTIDDETAAFDWGLYKDDFAPDAFTQPDVLADGGGFVDTSVWDAYYSAFEEGMGDTTGSWQDAMAANATRLGQMGERMYDAATLVDFEMNQADPIGGMLIQGAENAIATSRSGMTLCNASTDEDGNVIVSLVSYQRIYASQPDGGFLSVNGDRSVVTVVEGLYRLEEANGTTALFHADGTLNYIESVDGNRITATYADGQLASLVSDQGGTTSYDYNALGQLIAVTDPAGRTNHYSYDAAGNLISFESAGGFSGSLTYNTSGNAAGTISSISSSNGEETQFGYDEFGRFISRSTGDTFVSVAFDGVGGTVSTDTSGRSITSWRDQNDNVRRLVDDTGMELRLAYDASNRLTSTTASGAATQHFYYDENGNLSEVVDPLGYRTKFNYNSDYQLLSTRNAGGVTTAFTYDANGHLLSTVYADGTTEQMSYDSRGRLTSKTNRRGDTITYTYDPQRDLLTGKTFGSYAATYTYNTAGDLIMAADNNGSTSMEYNAAGQLTKTTYPNGKWLAFTYDDTGHRVQMSDQDGFAVNYEYNNLNMISRLSRADNSTIAQYTYDPSGLLQRKDLGNGQYSTYIYNDSGLLAGLFNHASNGALTSKFEYTYDLLGRRVSMTTLDGVYSYTYDLTSQLTSVTTPTGRTIEYTYDAMGNRLTVRDDGATTNYEVDALNQYSSVGSTAFDYDADGNLTSKTDDADQWTYTYDAEGHILAATGPSGTLTYQYDALGNRVSSTLDGVRTDYLLDPFDTDAVFAEFDASGDVIARYPRGYGLVGRVDGAGNDAYYHFDGSGNTVQLINAAEATLNAYEYLPFGETTSSTETVHNPFLFAGEKGIVAAGNGEYFANVRQYDPKSGRFLSPDWLFQPAANPYTYASNRPISRYDANGFKGHSLSQIGRRSGKLNNAGKVVGWVAGVGKKMDFQKVGVTNLQSALVLEANGVISSDTLSGPLKICNDMQASKLINKMDSTLKFMGAVDDGLTIANGVNSIHQYATGQGSGMDAVHDGAMAACAIISKFPTVPPTVWTPLIKVAQQAGNIDTASKFIFGQWFKHRPKPDSEIFGDRGMKHLLGKEAAKNKTHVANSQDPNDIIGPSGFGEPNWIAVEQVMPFTIRFENDAEEATAAAQQVIVTQTFDEDLDLSSFQLTGFGMGEITHDIPEGLANYETLIDLSETYNVVVDVEIELDVASRVASWIFTSLDPVTGLPTQDPFAGFLPPNETSPEGEGWVGYQIMPENDSTAGTTIDGQATIFFDFNDPIETNLWTNTLDAGPPSSQVATLPAETPGSSVLVSWSGTDEGGTGSGIAAFDVFVAKDEGPFTLWQAATTDTSASYAGEGIHTYHFYSVAIDNVGNREASPATPDTQTTLLDQWIEGTDDDDTFTFVAGPTPDTWAVQVNGVDQAVDPRASSVHFNGLDGFDTVVLTGTPGDDSALLHPTMARLSGDGYLVTAENVESSTVHSGGGVDTAHLYDSAGDDLFESTPDTVTLSGSGFSETVNGFTNVHAYALSGGTDIASMYDSVGNDTMESYPTYVRLYGPGYHHRTKFFEVVHAYGQFGGHDTAFMYDSAENDMVHSTPKYTKMFTETYFRRAKLFETVIAYSRAGGSDTACLYDSAGDDLFESTPDTVTLSGPGFSETMLGFANVHAYALSGGTDIASMYDSAGNDTMESSPTYVRLYGPGYYHRTKLFEVVHVYGQSGGDDTAFMYDSAENDTFHATPQYAKMYNASYFRRAKFFETVIAYATAGGADTALLYDSAGDDLFESTPDTVTLSGPGFSETVNGFTYVYGYANAGGTDTASMYDSVGNDTMESYPTYVRLYGSSYSHQVKSFEIVHAYGQSGGHDTAFMYDSAENDTFHATPQYAKMYNASNYRRAKLFETVNAYSIAGGTDNVYLWDSDGNDKLITTPEKVRLYNSVDNWNITARWFDSAIVLASEGNDTARMIGGTNKDTFQGQVNECTFYGTGYNTIARRFDQVSAYGSGSDDVASLYDTMGDDHLIVADNQASLKRSNNTQNLYKAIDFGTVHAYATGGVNTRQIGEVVDFVLDMQGDWVQELPTLLRW